LTLRQYRYNKEYFFCYNLRLNCSGVHGSLLFGNAFIASLFFNYKESCIGRDEHVRNIKQTFVSSALFFFSDILFRFDKYLARLHRFRPPCSQDCKTPYWWVYQFRFPFTRNNDDTFIWNLYEYTDVRQILFRKWTKETHK
jgi:hypothetical protein